MIDPTFTGVVLTNNAEITAANGGIDEDSTPGNNASSPAELGTDGDIDDEAPGTPGTGDNPADEDDFDPATVTIGQSFDLALEKNVDITQSYAPGDTVVFTINVYNQGTLAADSVVIFDYLPTGLINIDPAWPGDTHVSTNLPAGDVVTIPLTVRIDPTYQGLVLYNNAEIIDASGGIDEDGILQNTVGSANDTSELSSDGDIDDEAPGTPGAADNPSDEDNYDIAVLAIDQDFDLAITDMVGGTGPYDPGDTIVYMITVYNQGTLTASDIEVTSYVPTGMTNIDPAWPGDVFTISDLTSGQDTTILLSLVLDPTFTGTSTVHNVEITSALGGIDEDDDLTFVNGSSDDTSELLTDNDIDDEGAGTPGVVDNPTDVDDYDPAQIFITQIYDLALTKELHANSLGALAPGDAVSFTITVINQGTLPATNVEITDMPDPELIYLGSDAEARANVTELFAGGISFMVDNISVGSSQEIVVTFRIPEDFQDNVLFNNALITSDDGDDIDSNPDTDNNVDEDGDGNGDDDDEDGLVINLIQTFDLAISKSISSEGPFAPGSLIEFELLIENQGTLNAAGTIVSESPDPNLTFVSSNVATNGNITQLSDQDYSILSLLSGESETILVVYQIDEEFEGTSLNNAVQITADNGNDIDSDPETDEAIDEDGDGSGDDDDEDEVTIPIEQIFDLAITKQARAVGPFLAGDLITYDITVVNEGSLTAIETYFVDDAPAGLIYVSDNASIIDRVEALNDQFFVIDTLEPGGTITISLTYELSNTASVGFLTNIARIILDSGDDIDSNPDTDETVDENGDGAPFDDDEHPASIEVVAQYDLAIQKTTMQQGPIAHGDMIIYEIIVSNEGLVEAQDIEVMDIPDPFLDYKGSDVGSNPNIMEEEQMTFVIGSLLPGESDTFITMFELLEGFQDSIIFNIAEITADDGADIDSNPDEDITVDEDGDGLAQDDDEDVVGIPVDQIFDLALIQTLSAPGPFGPGDSVTFDILLINQGTLDATDIELTDYIPDGLILADPAWEQQLDIATIITLVDTLQAGDSTVLSITFVIDPDFTGGGITNVVEISGANGGVDIDSTPDQNNDDPEEDDVVDNMNGDEDDSDPEGIVVFMCDPLLPPTFDPACSSIRSSDVVFVIDNSQSIDSAEYAEFENILIQSIQKVQCECPLSRVAVLHYGGAFGAETFLEYDFANGGITNVERQFCTSVNASGFCNEGGDDLNAAMGALDSLITVGTLDVGPANKLSVVIFTDAFSFDTECSFVNCSVIRPYDNIDKLKADYSAQVTVVGVSEQAEEILLALYASPGGGYNGGLFEQDCASTFDSCALPRKYINIEFDSDPALTADSIFACISCEADIISNVLITTVEDQEICFNLGETATLSANIEAGAPPFIYRWSDGLGNEPVQVVAPQSDMTYFVTVTDDNGCSAIDSVHVASEECIICDADAGTPLPPSEICFNESEGSFVPDRNEGVFLPPGYEEVFILTDSALVILDMNIGRRSFEVPQPGLYRVHTLVADVNNPGSPNFLDLSIINLGVSNVFLVANCIADHGVCADFDFAGRVHRVLPDTDMMCMLVENTIFLCWDGIDNDGDGLEDCEDEDCKAFIVCQENTLVACNDNIDNDRDGLVDCFDDDCFIYEICNERREKCDDGIDNDGDGLIDCMDDACANEQSCLEESPTSCADGRDNDGDGLIDCQEPSCRGFLVCAEYSVEACSDGIDNDADGLVDCLDADCQEVYSEVCTDEISETLCNDGIDNDADGLVDCEDEGCAEIWPCYVVDDTKSSQLLDIRVFLEGAYDDRRKVMRDDLYRLGYLPGQTPTTLFGKRLAADMAYDAYPWGYEDKVIEERIKEKAVVDLYQDGTVDWVLVSLKRSIEGKRYSWRGYGLLQVDGQIKIMSELTVKPGAYYIVVEHRNHMPVMSSRPIEQKEGSWTYDFTEDQGYTSLLSFGQNKMMDGKFVMIAGNGDHIIGSSSYNDLNIFDLEQWQITNGQNSGYFTEDYDMNGDVNVKDRILWQKNNGKYVFLPDGR